MSPKRRDNTPCPHGHPLRRVTPDRPTFATQSLLYTMSRSNPPHMSSSIFHPKEHQPLLALRRCWPMRLLRLLLTRSQQKSKAAPIRLLPVCFIRRRSFSRLQNHYDELRADSCLRCRATLERCVASDWKSSSPFPGRSSRVRAPDHPHRRHPGW